MVDYSRLNQGFVEVTSSSPSGDAILSQGIAEVASRDTNPTGVKTSSASTEVVSRNGPPKPPVERVVMQASVEVVSKTASDPAVVSQAILEVVSGDPYSPPDSGLYAASVEVVSIPPGAQAYASQAITEVVSRIQFDMRIRPTNGDHWTWVPRGDIEGQALFKIFHNGIWQPVPVWVWYEPKNMWIRVV